MFDSVIMEIKKISSEYKNIKVVLFGSRSRDDNKKNSDYDIAVFSNTMNEIDKAIFFDKIQNINTLKKIDLIFLDNSMKEDDFIRNIKKEGIIIND